MPVVKAKSEYLHGEGLAQVAFAMNEYGIWDQEAWNILKEKIPEHQYELTIVKNDRWDLKQFVSRTGSEHFYE